LSAGEDGSAFCANKKRAKNCQRAPPSGLLANLKREGEQVQKSGGSKRAGFLQMPSEVDLKDRKGALQFLAALRFVVKFYFSVG